MFLCVLKMWLMSHFGPATRRGGLDKAGSEAVGAVVVARYGSNPMEVINNVKDKIKGNRSRIATKNPT